MKKYLLEVCCGSAQDVLEAVRGGADRVELNSCLFHGGLTPSVGELLVAKQEVGIPVMTMVRPRQGGFCYTDVEYRTALADAEKLLENGSDGLVFGFLHEDGSLDVERTKELVRMAGDKTKVFHRAIDVADDWKRMLGQLIEIGVDRVLTSGQEADVSNGTDTVREMIEYAAGRIQILPGAGITARNMDRIIAETGANQIHLAAHKPQYDTSVNNNRSIYYGGCLYPPEDRFNVIDSDYIGSMVQRLPG